MVDKVDAEGGTGLTISDNTAQTEQLSSDHPLAELLIEKLNAMNSAAGQMHGALSLPFVIELPPHGAMLVYLDIDIAAHSENERYMLVRFAEQLHARANGIATLNFDALIEVAERAVAALPVDKPAASIPNQLVGPFYDAAGLSKWLGITRQAIHKRNGTTLLALHTRDRSVVYPSFQFMADGSTIPNLMSAVAQLAPVLPDPWGQAQWVTTKVSDLGDRSVADALKSGRRRDKELAMSWVRAEAARLAA